MGGAVGSEVRAEGGVGIGVVLPEVADTARDSRNGASVQVPQETVPDNLALDGVLLSGELESDEGSLVQVGQGAREWIKR